MKSVLGLGYAWGFAMPYILRTQRGPCGAQRKKQVSGQPRLIDLLGDMEHGSIDYCLGFMSSSFGFKIYCSDLRTLTFVKSSEREKQA